MSTQIDAHVIILLHDRKHCTEQLLKKKTLDFPPRKSTPVQSLK